MRNRHVKSSDDYYPILGREAYDFIGRLFPLNRSLTGDGVRQTLQVIKEYVPDLTLVEVPTGTRCFDWVVPQEWSVKEAWIKNSKGDKIVDYAVNNLHLVGYSSPVSATLTLEQLQPHLYSLPDLPEAVPYLTSYYSSSWGFCISQSQRDQLESGYYEVCIDSNSFDGSMTYGEVLIPGVSRKEIFFSTYICHPSMANNELSGPAVATFLAKELKKYDELKYSYRIVFLPETIGSIFYISKHLQELKENMMAGYVLTCLGDTQRYSYLPSRNGNTLADRVALHILRFTDENFEKYSYLDRGSDERQYNSPGVDLPVCSLMRSKYGTYKEYHSSLDNLDFVSATGLAGSIRLLIQIIDCLEGNKIPVAKILCEPQLSKRGLYPTLSSRDSGIRARKITNLLAYSDGERDLLAIANLLECSIFELIDLADKLATAELLELRDLESDSS